MLSVQRKGESSVKHRFHLHDLSTTILHLMGLDHEKLTNRYSGRDDGLIDVHVLHKIIA